MNTLLILGITIIILISGGAEVSLAATQKTQEVQSASSSTAANTSTEAHTSNDDHSETKSEQESEGVIGMFGLNWKLFLAQLVNFSIVLFVLWKWVFKPVTSGMEARAKKIEDSLVNAQKIEHEKAEFEQWHKEEMGKARTEANSIISEAKKTALQAKEEILTQTKQEQDSIVEKAKAQLEQEKISAITDAKSQIADLIVNSTEKLINQKLDPKQDSKIINDTLKDL